MTKSYPQYKKKLSLHKLELKEYLKQGHEYFYDQQMEWVCH